MIEDRERLRLELETFLREKYRLGEQWASEQWDADLLDHAGLDAVAALFRGPGATRIMRIAPRPEFERWRESRA